MSCLARSIACWKAARHRWSDAASPHHLGCFHSQIGDSTSATLTGTLSSPQSPTTGPIQSRATMCIPHLVHCHRHCCSRCLPWSPLHQLRGWGQRWSRRSAGWSACCCRCWRQGIARAPRPSSLRPSLCAGDNGEKTRKTHGHQQDISGGTGPFGSFSEARPEERERGVISGVTTAPKQRLHRRWLHRR